MAWLPWAKTAAATATAARGGDPLHDERDAMDENPLSRDTAVEVDAEDEPSELLDAAQRGDATAVYLLVEGGVDVNTREARALARYFPFEGFTALHYASREGHANVVKALLAAEADVEAVDDQCGATALQEASLAGHVDVVRLLLADGADPHAGRVEQSATSRYRGHNTKPPLYLASGAGWDAIVDTLLQAGARPEDGDLWHQRPLHIAAKENRLKAVERLLAGSADVNVVDCQGHTPLHIAIRNGSVDVALRLLKAPRINVDARDPQTKLTALHMAAEHELPIVIEALLRMNPKLEAQDTDGKTPLHIACWSEVPASVRLLLESGADVSAETAEAQVPMDYAFPTRNITIYCKVPETLEIIRLLLSHGAKWDSYCEDELNAKFRKAARPAVRLCVALWEAERAQGRPLSKIPPQAVESGETATLTYINELAASKDVTLRRKVCVVGPSQWGKTSLIKSVTQEKTIIADRDDRTLGVDLFKDVFQRATSIGATEHNDIIFWDFAGHDEYHAAHSLFYSRNTLYLVCIDVEVFRLALMQAQLMADTRDQRTRFIEEFVDERILRWVLTIVAHHVDAEFEFVLTKFDTLERGFELYVKGTQSRPHDFESEVLIATAVYVLRMQAIIDNMRKVHKVRERQKIVESVPVAYSVKPRVVTSVGDPRLSDLEYTPPMKISAVTSCRLPEFSRGQLLALIFKNDISFPMPDKYTRVLEELKEILEMRVKKGIVRVTDTMVAVDDIVQDLCARVGALERATCRVILRTLRDLGDILWYEDLGVARLRETVFLDPQVAIDFVRQIINHQHGSETMSHATLKGLPLWNTLDRESLYAMKKLMQHFQLVHPTAGDMTWDSDLLVPAFRRTNTCAAVMFLGMTLGLGPLDARSPESCHVHWEYHFESGLPGTLFDFLAVESYSAMRERTAGPDWILYGNPMHDTYACRIMVSRDLASKHRTLQLEAVLAETASREDEEALWNTFEHLSSALVRVLGRFNGLVLSQCALDRHGKAFGFPSLFATTFPKPRPAWMPPAETWAAYKNAELDQDMDRSAAEVFD